MKKKLNKAWTLFVLWTYSKGFHGVLDKHEWEANKE